MFQGEDGDKFGWETKFGSKKNQPDLEDFRHNGKFCKTGLAFQSAPNEATCVSTKSVIIDGKEAEAPYQCNPADYDNKCVFKFDAEKYANQAWLDLQGTTNDRINVNCSCSLEDEVTGYCSDVIGTDAYIKYARQMYYVLSNSNCHTLDRYDIRAQRDLCGLPVKTDQEWWFAVSHRFNVTHWPYIHKPENYHCVQKFFADSYINLSLDLALYGFAVSVSAIALSLQSYLW